MTKKHRPSTTSTSAYSETHYGIVPGGIRHRASIRRLVCDTRLRQHGDVWRTLSPTGQLLDIAVPARTLIPPVALATSVAGGWVAYASWTNEAQTPIIFFETSWLVPPEPKRQSQQQIYLFNGLQNPSRDHILQPVLQWGMRSGIEGSGAFWTVSSWWAPPANGAPIFVTHPGVRVQPGSQLTGRITAEPRRDGLFTYSCEFVGIPATRMTVTFSELTNCVEVLEAYGAADLADYPGTQRTVFSGIRVRLKVGEPDVVWAVGGAFPPDVLDNSPTNGEVDIVYPGTTA